MAPTKSETGSRADPILGQRLYLCVDDAGVLVSGAGALKNQALAWNRLCMDSLVPLLHREEALAQKSAAPASRKQQASQQQPTAAGSREQIIQKEPDA
ncbi:MAG: hypothetical protein IT492_14795 [Gammaproteobacteria bacterium]|nr:hypothetical protein [Gammaproteobacteria bacterium]